MSEMRILNLIEKATPACSMWEHWIWSIFYIFANLMAKKMVSHFCLYFPIY